MIYRRFLTPIVAQILTGVGTVIALTAWDAADGLRLALGLFVVALTLSSVGLEVRGLLEERGRTYKTTAHINRFMHDWISERGRVVIFSNDMSWVSDDVHLRWYEKLKAKIRNDESLSIHELLIEKANRDELTLCLPRENDLSRELEAAGTQVATYEELKITPEARFTIVRHGQANAEVAIGHREQGVHRIATFENGRHPAFAMAEDLVKFVTRYSEDR
jgi:hypothetical protein